MTQRRKTRSPGRRFMTVLLTLVMIVSLTPSLGALTGGAVGAQDVYAAQEITIQGGEYTISGLISEYDLTSADTLKVGYGTTIVVDTWFEIDRIVPLTTNPSLTIQGDGRLTVHNGVSVGQGSFTMESGELFIDGPYPTGNPNAGISAGSVTINGGTINIAFDDTDHPNQCGFRTSYFLMNAGQATVDISGTGSGYTSGIYSQSNDGYAVIKDGTLDIDVKNSLGYPYGIYNATYPGYVVDIRGGTTDIDVRRTNSESNYAGAGGIIGAQNNIYVKDGSLSVDVVNEGQDAIGITGGHFDIYGGTLEVSGVSSKEGRKGYGIKSDEDAAFLMSGGTVAAVGSTYSTSSGEGIGIYYSNSTATKRIDISGGELTATGTTAGIYVYNGSDDTPGQTQIYGDAKVTASSNKIGICGARDTGGWRVFGDAELTSIGTEQYGLYTEGPLVLEDTPVAVFETQGGSFQALYADGITIGDLLQISKPEGGKINTDNNSIVNADNSRAKEVWIQSKDVVKINVLFYDESTLARITNPSLMVYKNNGAWQAGGGDPVRFSVGKGDDFTLTTGISTTGEYGTEYNDYEFVGWYKGGYPGTSPISTNTTTPTQRITEDTWYYAVYAPPKTEIPALHFHVDKTPVKGQKRDTVGQTVTVDEAGITISGTAWVQENYSHFAEDHVFTPGETVILMVDYSVDESYKLANDIGTNTTINGEPVSEHDTSNTVFYQQYMVPFDLEEEGKVEVTGIVDKTYTGKVITQSPLVKYEDTELTPGTDYELSYSNNINPGTATMTVTGKGNYTGKVTKTFKITRKACNVKNLWASQHDVGRVLFKWTKEPEFSPSGWVVKYRTKKIGGGSWSGWTEKTFKPGSNEFKTQSFWCPVPVNYVVEIHAKALGDTSNSQGIITTPAGGKYQAMKTVFVKQYDAKTKTYKRLTSDTINLKVGQQIKLKPDYEYPVADFKKRPRLYPTHALWDLTAEGKTMLKITKPDGSAYSGGIIDGTATIKAVKEGTATLICRAPNGRTKVLTVVIAK